MDGKWSCTAQCWDQVIKPGPAGPYHGGVLTRNPEAYMYAEMCTTTRPRLLLGFPIVTCVVVKFPVITMVWQGSGINSGKHLAETFEDLNLRP